MSSQVQKSQCPWGHLHLPSQPQEGLGSRHQVPTTPHTFNALHCRKAPTLIPAPPQAQSLGALLSSLACCQLAPVSEDGS